MNWSSQLKPLFDRYHGARHPLEYKNRYQLVIMMVLSSQDRDDHINKIAPGFFQVYPTMKHLAKARPHEVRNRLMSVRDFNKKSEWLIKLAQIVGEDDRIPTTLEGLTQLPGIGRKSANMILRESALPAEGVFVDLHVLRVAPRIGIAKADTPENVEQQLMETLPQQYWHDTGMAFSFLGREVCRPTSPKCSECVVNAVCDYFRRNVKGKQ